MLNCDSYLYLSQRVCLLFDFLTVSIVELHYLLLIVLLRPQEGPEGGREGKGKGEEGKGGRERGEWVRATRDSEREYPS